VGDVLETQGVGYHSAGGLAPETGKAGASPAAVLLRDREVPGAGRPGFRFSRLPLPALCS